MKTLSIQQPWAWAILHIGKDVENRTWPAYHFGPVLIHASKKYDKAGEAWIRGVAGIAVPADLPRGGIVGQVTIKGCCKWYASIWYRGPYGFLLQDPQPLPFFQWPGKLGFFDFPDELLPRLGLTKVTEPIKRIKRAGDGDH